MTHNCDGEGLEQLSVNLDEIEVLSCRDNRLTGLDEGEGATLIKLDFHGNCLRSLADLPELPRLQWLDVSKNEINAGAASTFGISCFPALEHLDISENKFIDVLDGFEGLVWLAADRNETRIVSTRRQAARLEFLSLCENRLEGSLQGIDGAMPRLRELRLDGNLLTSVTSLEKCPSLTSVSARNNLLTNVGCELRLPRLQALDLTANKLTTLDRLNVSVQNPTARWAMGHRLQTSLT